MYKKCVTAYHPTCAINASLEILPPSAEFTKFSLHCPRHDTRSKVLKAAKQERCMRAFEERAAIGTPVNVRCRYGQYYPGIVAEMLTGQRCRIAMDEG